MAFTKVVGAGIHTLSNITSHNIHSSGIVTATGLDISGDATIGGVLTYEDVTSIDSVGLITARNGIDCNADLDVDGHTNLDNVSIAGVSTFNGGSTFGSSINLGGELNFTGNGHKYIDVATLNGSNTLTIRHQDGGSYETAAYFDANGGAYLQFNGSTKFATTNTGGTVTGDFVFGANAKAKLFENGGQSGIQATNSGSSAHLMTHDGNEDIHLDPSGYIKFEVAGPERLRIDSSGNVGLGTVAVSAGDLATGTTIGLPKLHVDCGHLGNGAYHIARFRAGSDNDNNAAVLTLNHSNDRGLALYGGRSSSDRSWIALKSIDSSGRVSDAIEIIGNDGRGVQDLKFYTGDSTTTTERLRITAAGNLKIPDDGKIELGGAQTGTGDFSIYHDGSNLYLDTGTGLFYSDSTIHILRNKAGTQDVAKFAEGASGCMLYCSNGVKLTTTTTGITVTGEVAASQDYPNIRPALDFNFAAVKKLDSRFRYYRLGGASYIDENGLVKFVSENQPRFDHDPVTREPKGLLIEQTRTNLLRYSHGDGFKSQGHMNDYTVGWVQQDTTNSTITPNAALGPDGTMSALKYTLNATSGRRLDYEEVDLDNSTTYCWSWWMKRLASNAVWSFQFVGGTSATNHSILIDGVAASGQTTTYTPPDDKWHRVTWKFTTQANADEQDLGGYDSSGGTGDRWLLWGAQLEAGAFPTSLIPTRGNKATRGSEEIHMGSDRDGSSALDRTILNIFDDHEGTIVAEWETQESETNQNLISFHKDLSSAERVEIRATGSSTSNVRAEIVTGGSSVATIQVAHSGLQKNTKAAFGFQKDNFSISVNGGAVSTDTSGNMPSDINSLMIGKGTWGTYFDGHLKRFMYYPKNLPDSQLITLTS